MMGMTACSNDSASSAFVNYDEPGSAVCTPTDSTGLVTVMVVGSNSGSHDVTVQGVSNSFHNADVVKWETVPFRDADAANWPKFKGFGKGWKSGPEGRVSNVVKPGQQGAVIVGLRVIGDKIANVKYLDVKYRESGGGEGNMRTNMRVVLAPPGTECSAAS
ncbi:hypothetical protein ACMYYO_14720 [Dermacoccaceae bacterium W4C1]